MRKPHVLVVDDNEFYRSALERMLSRAGYAVASARDGGEALALISAQPLDLVLCDVKMPGISGHELVRQVHEVNPDLPCIVITGYGGAESSLEALQAGAYWYLDKGNEQSAHDVLRKLAAQAIEHGRLKAENRQLQRQLQGRYRFDQVVGASEPLRRVLDLVERVADTDSTVLITGESGTGKELVARAIHFNSARAERMFITVNCGAIPEELLESELFGHVRGAFTNAVAARDGRFTLAHGGTIFLDEIGDMSPSLQVKLLRVLQDRSFEPVGSSQTQRVDVRVIAATNQDLAVAIRERRFREDLFYRLNVIPIETPPLRSRKDDIPLLVSHFLKKIQEERRVPACSLERDALELLCAHDWPGNVRELENTIERLVVLKGGGSIGVADLPAPLRAAAPPAAAATPKLPARGLPLGATVDRFEAELIRQALEQTGWNKNQAAKLLAMNRTTLLEKIKKHGLSPDQ
ncbi:MAG TPA: sigma-54 dependent transcriptional regulator [Myxococcota bacterium]|nr:sigma-54 dependent transcriptional regulator [Myxococcota bacterium]